MPRGYAFILDDEPDYGVSCGGGWLTGLEQIPVPVDPDALVVSDNADVYGTVADLRERRSQG